MTIVFLTLRLPQTERTANVKRTEKSYRSLTSFHIRENFNTGIVKHPPFSPREPQSLLIHSANLFFR